jgi:hypothetical protein
MSSTPRIYGHLALASLLVLGAIGLPSAIGWWSSGSASGEPALGEVAGEPGGSSDPSESVVFSLDHRQATALLRLSLGPEALASAGLTPLEAKGVIDAGVSAWESFHPALSEADAKAAALRGPVEDLARQVRAGKTDAGQVEELATMREALTVALAERKQVLDGFWAAATEGTNQSARASLATLRANAHWQLPSAYLVVERTQAEWVALRNVLDHHAVCAELGTAPKDSMVYALQTAKANQSVAEALAAAHTYLPAIQAAWDAALSQK